MRWSFGAAAAFAFVLFAAWFVLSPYIVIWQLENAVRNGDARALADLVDFPAVRESVKASLGPTPAGTALGAGIAMLLAEPVVDGMLTPEGVAAMLRTSSAPPSTTAPAGSAPAPPFAVGMHYLSIDRFGVALAWAPAHARLEARLCRTNVFAWHLCSISMRSP